METVRAHVPAARACARARATENEGLNRGGRAACATAATIRMKGRTQTLQSPRRQARDEYLNCSVLQKQQYKRGQIRGGSRARTIACMSSSDAGEVQTSAERTTASQGDDDLLELTLENVEAVLDEVQHLRKYPLVLQKMCKSNFRCH